MASMLKKEQLSEKDAALYNVDRWMQTIKGLITARDIFCKCKDQFSIEVLFAE